MSLAENVETLPPPRGGNYEFARFNALRHGVLSQHTVLPWEDGEEYLTLVEALVAEHKPQGPTEEHLVEELAGVIWRKRRLRLGENAAHHRALMRAVDPYQHTAKAALIGVAEDVEVDSIDDADDYEEDQVAYAADAPSLRRFLEAEILAWYEKRRQELEYRPLIRAQAFGEAVDPNRLERLARYEVHLDRKLERMLAMLFKLQELRRAANPT